MAQLSIRQEMKMISLLIMRMRMNERNIFMLLLLTIVLIVKRRSGRFRRFRKKQKKFNGVLGDLVGEIHRYITVVMEANEGISTYFKKQTESNDRKMRIYDELMELSDFSQQEIMDVGEYILKNDHKVDNFFALPKAFRRDYVMKQLSQIKHK